LDRAHWAGNFETDVMANEVLPKVDEEQLQGYNKDPKECTKQVKAIACNISIRDTGDSAAHRLKFLRLRFIVKWRRGETKLSRIAPHGKQSRTWGYALCAPSGTRKDSGGEHIPERPIQPTKYTGHIKYRSQTLCKA
jgi:hypothetical protein